MREAKEVDLLIQTSQLSCRREMLLRCLRSLLEDGWSSIWIKIPILC